MTDKERQEFDAKLAAIRERLKKEDGNRFLDHAKFFTWPLGLVTGSYVVCLSASESATFTFERGRLIRFGSVP